MRQVIVTTVFGSGAGQLAPTFLTFARNPDSELHAFVFGKELPAKRYPEITYHLVEPDPRFVSTRRDALFRRWTLPDTLGAEHALVVDGTDVICLRPLPRFETLLRGAALAAAPEWFGPIPISGQGYTSTYMNAGVTFWHLPGSRRMREEIVARGRRHYRGPFDDQVTLNEVMLTKYFDQVVILPSQYNWRAFYRKEFRSWRNGWRRRPRVDSLDGVYLFHTNYCLDEAMQTLAADPPKAQAELPELPEDRHPLSRSTLLARRLLHRWRYG